MKERSLKSNWINKCRLVISASIWKRNSHGLYDHESTEVDKYELALITNNLFAQSSSGELKTFEVNETPESNYNLLFKAISGTLRLVIGEGRQKWTIEACTSKEVHEDPETQLWEVLENEHKLKRGDILRIGRVLLKVKDYRSESSSLCEDRISSPNEDNVIDLKTKNDCPSSTEDVCRVCFGNEIIKENPLLSLCKCTGSMKYIHFLCVKTWLHSAVEERVTEQLISYYWKSFHCEICTAAYPCTILLNT